VGDVQTVADPEALSAPSSARRRIVAVGLAAAAAAVGFLLAPGAWPAGQGQP
jgi:hypothetical protein